MHYSVCVSAVFSRLSMEEAIARVREAGLDTYEFWGWWDKDISAVQQAQKQHGLRLAAMCTRMIPLNDPKRREDFLHGLEESLAVAKQLDCRTLIAQVGQDRAECTREEQNRSIVDGLKACVPLLEENGVVLTIEPLNTLVDHKGYFLARSDEAFQIVREVNSPYVKVLFDIYHQQITEGNLIPNLTGNVEWIGHVHIAGHPGRHEPYGRNEIHYPAVLGALKEAGYRGMVGLEYFPLGDAMESLKTLQREIPL